MMMKWKSNPQRGWLVGQVPTLILTPCGRTEANLLHTLGRNWQWWWRRVNPQVKNWVLGIPAVNQSSRIGNRKRIIQSARVCHLIPTDFLIGLVILLCVCLLLDVAAADHLGESNGQGQSVGWYEEAKQIKVHLPVLGDFFTWPLSNKSYNVWLIIFYSSNFLVALIKLDSS